MGIFHCYVSLPEGTKKLVTRWKNPAILEAVLVKGHWNHTADFGEHFHVGDVSF